MTWPVVGVRGSGALSRQVRLVETGAAVQGSGGAGFLADHGTLAETRCSVETRRWFRTGLEADVLGQAIRRTALGRLGVGNPRGM